MFDSTAAWKKHGMLDSKATLLGLLLGQLFCFLKPGQPFGFFKLSKRGTSHLCFHPWPQQQRQVGSAEAQDGLRANVPPPPHTLCDNIDYYGKFLQLLLHLRKLETACTDPDYTKQQYQTRQIFSLVCLVSMGLPLLQVIVQDLSETHDKTGLQLRPPENPNRRSNRLT